MTVIVLQVTYGLVADRSDDPYVLSVAKALEDFSEIAAPGAYLVDSLPFRMSSHASTVIVASFLMERRSEIRPRMVSWGFLQDAGERSG